VYVTSKRILDITSHWARWSMAVASGADVIDRGSPDSLRPCNGGGAFVDL
jgi:hypothetical protein